MVSIGDRLIEGISKGALHIGSSDVNEQLVPGNMYTDMIEAKANYKVQRDPSLGGVQVYSSVLRDGQIDMYVDYTRTLYGGILKTKPNSNADEVYRVAKDKIKEQYDLTLLDQIPFNNVYTSTVRRDTAGKYNLKTVGNLKKVSGRLTITLTLALNNRKRALPGIKNRYPNTNFQDSIIIDGAAHYVTLANKESDVIDTYSTDGLVDYHDLVILEDDKQYFLPYYGIFTVSGHLPTKHPGAVGMINEFSRHLNSEGMRKLNYEADMKRREPAGVAHEFLV